MLGRDGNLHSVELVGAKWGVKAGFGRHVSEEIVTFVGEVVAARVGLEEWLLGGC